MNASDSGGLPPAGPAKDELYDGAGRWSASASVTPPGGSSPPSDDAAGVAAGDGPGSDGERGEPGGASEPAGSDATGRRIGRPGAGRDRGRGSFLRELPVLVLIAFLLALLIKALLIQAFWIPSESMERTLLVNDRVLVNKVIYHFRDVHRGDIVVFNGKGTGFDHQESLVPPPSNAFSKFVRGAQNLLGLGAPSETDFIKRVIGVGGDTVACCDSEGRVTVNGQPLDEPYVYQNDYQRFGPVVVPDGDLWVMGDHRGASSDSRANGPIPKDKVVGRAFVRVWPVNRFGFLGSPHTFDHVPAPAARASTPTVKPAAGAAEPLPSGADAPDYGSLLALAVVTPPAWSSTRRRSRLLRGSAPGSDRRPGSP